MLAVALLPETVYCVTTKAEIKLIKRGICPECAGECDMDYEYAYCNDCGGDYDLTEFTKVNKKGSSYAN